MLEDEIVAEVRRVREEHAARLNNDLDAICADLKAQQDRNHRKVVAFEPKAAVQPRDESRVAAG